MLFNSSQLSLNIILLVFLGIYNQVDMAVHQCYVCGVKDALDCNEFNSDNQAFIKKCPSSNSCQIVTYFKLGNKQELDCAESFEGQDCQVANSIRYCYCLGDLCNMDLKVSDDEDLEEGSGTTKGTPAIKDTEQKEPKSPNITNQSNHLQLYLYSAYISVLAILCN